MSSSSSAACSSSSNNSTQQTLVTHIPKALPTSDKLEYCLGLLNSNSLLNLAFQATTGIDAREIQQLSDVTARTQLIGLETVKIADQKRVRVINGPLMVRQIDQSLQRVQDSLPCFKAFIQAIQYFEHRISSQTRDLLVDGTGFRLLHYGTKRPTITEAQRKLVLQHRHTGNLAFLNLLTSVAGSHQIYDIAGADHNLGIGAPRSGQQAAHHSIIPRLRVLNRSELRVQISNAIKNGNLTRFASLVASLSLSGDAMKIFHSQAEALVKRGASWGEANVLARKITEAATNMPPWIDAGRPIQGRMEWRLEKAIENFRSTTSAPVDPLLILDLLNKGIPRSEIDWLFAQAKTSKTPAKALAIRFAQKNWSPSLNQVMGPNNYLYWLCQSTLNTNKELNQADCILEQQLRPYSIKILNQVSRNLIDLKTGFESYLQKQDSILNNPGPEASTHHCDSKPSVRDLVLDQRRRSADKHMSDDSYLALLPSGGLELSIAPMLLSLGQLAPQKFTKTPDIHRGNIKRLEESLEGLSHVTKLVLRGLDASHQAFTALPLGPISPLMLDRQVDTVGVSVERPLQDLLRFESPKVFAALKSARTVAVAKGSLDRLSSHWHKNKNQMIWDFRNARAMGILSAFVSKIEKYDTEIELLSQGIDTLGAQWKSLHEKYEKLLDALPKVTDAKKLQSVKVFADHARAELDDLDREMIHMGGRRSRLRTSKERDFVALRKEWETGKNRNAKIWSLSDRQYKWYEKLVKDADKPLPQHLAHDIRSDAARVQSRALDQERGQLRPFRMDMARELNKLSLMMKRLDFQQTRTLASMPKGPVQKMDPQVSFWVGGGI